MKDERRVVRRGNRWCWEWTGAHDGRGYGAVKYDGRQTFVHRMSAHLHLGLDLSDVSTLVLHHCDNPPCFRPSHLYLGTYADNLRDYHDRVEVRRPMAVLSSSDADAIRNEWGGHPAHVVADQFNVSMSTVHRIREGRAWRQTRGVKLACPVGCAALFIEQGALDVHLLKQHHTCICGWVGTSFNGHVNKSVGGVHRIDEFARMRAAFGPEDR